MRQNLNLTNPYYEFFKSTVHEAPGKFPGTLVALLMYYVCPLIFHWELLLSPMMIAPLIVCSLIFLTQPAASSDQLQNPSDKSSMKYLFWATWLSQAAEISQWAYLNEVHVFSGGVANFFGLLIMVVGLIVRVEAIIELREFFANTIYIRDDHRLIKTGIYKYVRHGSYTGAYLIGLGIGVYFSAWWGVMLSAVVLGVAYRYRILHEEIALVACFGDEYRQYQKDTYMLIPFVL
ncbi:isoprenylcysteine carboxylmethyltransferase family protein [Dyadobacter sp. CY261]|uniref:methyltransferase family protein n=1 Tax=Dyadobacter sp. CY261 TaxID=2907203 RepID=UPI001F373382|nr:isoprenylcysteine carboxylmethyltransferase family protein [Dyadobacter sp. CY261]MCF0070817.1 isoprenylcysteine carboxylmethyltransferase family protein [Dyadobacter sp. CY261]